MTHGINMVSKNQGILNEIDALIKQGRGAAAAKRLKALRTKGFQPEERALFAALARRLSLPNLSIRLLNPYVRPPEGQTLTVATNEEKCEYAAALIYVGAVEEAMEILNEKALETQPKTFLFRAFAHIGLWNYDEVVPILKRYIEFPSLTHYEKLVGKANLCDALAHNRAAEALPIIQETIKESAEHSYVIIQGYAEMTLIDLLLSREELDGAAEALSKAEEAFRHTDTVQTFLCRKWEALIELHRKGGTRDVLKRLAAVRSEAAERWKSWETVRDCDFYQAIRTKNLELGTHVYQGTPFKEFRERLLSQFPELAPHIKTSPRWRMSQSRETGEKIKLMTGDGPLRKKFLKSGDLIQKMVHILTEDFYRPLRVGALAFRLFPGEYFNPDSTPGRVKFLAHRLRRWFQTEHLPLTVEEISGGFRLISKRPVTLELGKTALGDPAKGEIELLREKTSGSFNVKEVCDLLSISPRTANRLLKEAEEKGLLKREGKGRATHYVWTAPLPLKIAA